jgi:hypothetical protein
MNKFVLGALALTMATTPALATETSWSATDRDLAGLSTSLTQGATGVSVSGFLRSSYASSSDIQVGTDDLGGFSIDDAQIWVNGSIGDFSVVVQSEASSSSNTIGDVGGTGALSLLDAYASWKATEQLKVQLGQFRPAFLGSSLRNENNLLFINRSALGAEFAFRDQGLQLSSPRRQVARRARTCCQHAHNPVDWYPWGPEALERASARTSRSSSRSATRPATGAT